MSDKDKNYPASTHINVQEELTYVSPNEEEPELKVGGRVYNRGYDSLNRNNEAEGDVSFQHALSVSQYVYRHNPIAKRLVEARLSQVVGSDVSIVCGDNEPRADGQPTIQEIVDAFWNHPRNPISHSLFSMERDLSVNGTVFWPVFVSEMTGSVIMSLLPSWRIHELYTEPIDPRYISTLVDYDDNQYRLWHVINPSMDSYGSPAPSGFVPEEFEDMQYIGSGFLFRTNKQEDYVFGWGDLYPLTDWLLQMDDFVQDLFAYIYLASAVVWDYELEGMTQEQIDKWLLTQTVPGRGAMFAHNEKLKARPVSPTLQAFNHELVLKSIMRLIAGSYGIDPAVIGWPQSSSRATSAIVDNFTLRGLTIFQKEIEQRIRIVIDFVIDQGLKARNIDPTTRDKTYSVVLPIIDIGSLLDLARTLQLFGTFITSLSKAGINLNYDVVGSLLELVFSRMGIRGGDFFAELKDTVDNMPDDTDNSNLAAVNSDNNNNDSTDNNSDNADNADSADDTGAQERLSIARSFLAESPEATESFETLIAALNTMKFNAQNGTQAP